MKPPASITILGGEGFVGKNIRDFLQNEYQCVSVGKTLSSFAQKKEGFICTDPYQEKLSLDSDILIHLINNPLVGEEFVEAEQRLIENTFTPKLRHVIVFSSAVVYAAPDSEYGQRKQALENIFQDECQKRGIPLTIFRLFNTFGRYQLPYRQGSLIANIICNHLQGLPTEINDLTAERDFLFAGDIGRFVAHVLDTEREGVFDLASNHLRSIGEIINLLEEEVLKEKIDIENKNLVETIKSSVGENPFLEKIPMTDLAVSLQETVGFYRNSLEKVLKM